MSASARIPPLRDFADRGTAWLLESPENLRGLVALLEGRLAAQLDFSRATPVHRPVVSDDLDKRLNDVLFRVPYREGSSEVWVCILLEHQSAPDPWLGFRLLRYMVGVWGLQVRAWKRRKSPGPGHGLLPIVPIVFYTGSRPWNAPLTVEASMDLPAALARFVPRHDTLFLNLKETPPHLLAGSAVAHVLRVMQVEDAPLEELERVLAAAVIALEELSDQHQVECFEALYYLLLMIRHRRAEKEQEPLVTLVTNSARKHRRDVDEMRKMSAVETWTRRGRREGFQKGLDKGLDQGLHQGLVVGLLKLLQARFGALPQHVPGKLQDMPVERLESLFEKATLAMSLAELALED